MQVSQNVVRTLQSDPTFKPDKDSVVEQLMGQIRNMEDTISSVLVALEHGPDLATICRLNQGCIFTVYDDIETIYGLNQGGGGCLYTLNINIWYYL